MALTRRSESPILERSANGYGHSGAPRRVHDGARSICAGTILYFQRYGLT